jgi:23S rRNA (cytidine1920-2'-O)/16S rRNA (cytidine1409-2'-O)-methyltransferase
VVTPRRRRFVALVDLLAQLYPNLDASAAISEGRVLVDGRHLMNPKARVRVDASLRVAPVRRLRGDVKLAHALDTLGVPVVGRIVVDVGASAGGFTTALLDRGARCVYAVDAGVGQLVGRLRNDPRVVNLEGHNLAALDRTIVPDIVDLVTMDLSYLAIRDAVPQLASLDLEPHADLVVLVKPTFELRRATLARSESDVENAIEHAARGITRSGWHVIGRCDAPTTGRHGAREAFLHATRDQPRGE